MQNHLNANLLNMTMIFLVKLHQNWLVNITGILDILDIFIECDIYSENAFYDINRKLFLRLL